MRVYFVLVRKKWYYVFDLEAMDLWVLRVQLGRTKGGAVNQEFAEVSL